MPDVRLIPVEKQHCEFLRKLHNHPAVLSQLTDPRPINEVEQEAWFQSICQSSKAWRMLVILDGGPAIADWIGCARFDGYDPIHRTVMIGGDIHPKFRVQGFGQKMFEACLAYAFDSLNCHTVRLTTLETNAVARHVYEKAGMKEEGRQREAIRRAGRYVDLICMSMTEEEYRARPT